MRGSWKLFALIMPLAAALAAPSGLRAQGEPSSDQVKSKTLTPAEQIDELKELVKTLTGKIDALTFVVQRDSKAREEKAMAVKQDIDGLKEQVAQLQKQIDRLNQRSSSSERISFFGPSGTMPTTGQLRLVNTWFEPVTIVVGTTAYTLLPGQTNEIRGIPAGTVSYEVLNIQPQRSLLVAAGETRSVIVHPK
jgi:hypothetical protein